MVALWTNGRPCTHESLGTVPYLPMSTNKSYFLIKKSIYWDATLQYIPLLLLFSHLVMSDFLQPHGLKYTRLPYPSLSPRVCSNSCPLSQWCHPTVSSIVAPFFSCPQPFPASGSFPMSQLFASGSESIGAPATFPSSTFYTLGIHMTIFQMYMMTSVVLRFYLYSPPLPWRMICFSNYGK